MHPLARLRRALSGAPRGRGTGFYDLAQRVASVPHAEMAVTEAALAHGGPVAERLLRQLRKAGDVWRLIADDGTYELRVSTTDDLSVRGVPRAGWASEWLLVTADRGGQPLELQVVVHEAGIVGLRGRTRDGSRWPRVWRVRAKDLDEVRARAPWLDLPSPAVMGSARGSAAAISAWLGQGEVPSGPHEIHAGPPASREAVEELAETERFAMPEAYSSLLRRADGIEIGSLIVLGTRDAYRLDMPGPARLVIAPPNEEGVLVIAETGEVMWIESGDETTDGRVVGRDLRQWLTTQLARS